MSSEIEKLKEAYLECLKITIDDAGCIYPYPALVLKKDNNIEFIAADIEPKDLIKHMLSVAADRDVICLIFGIDRNAAPNQGIDPKWSNVFSITCMVPFKELTFGVFPYNTKEDCAEDIDWDNEFWEKICHAELIKVIAEKRGLSVEETIIQGTQQWKDHVEAGDLKANISPN